jgi:phenylacetate-CoA ligase
MYLYLLENIIIPIGDFFNESSFARELKKWRSTDTYSEEKLENCQNENLKKILLHAVKTVPTYKHINLKGNCPKLWLNEFPILTKEILRNSKESLISNVFKKEDLIAYSSSGSSGVQSTVYMTKKEQSIIRAILTHWWEWSGYKIGKPIVQTGMTIDRGFLKTIKDFLFRTKYINAFSLTNWQLKTLCKEFDTKKSHFLGGYASSLNVIAEYAINNNYNIEFKSVISWGDKMFNHYQKNITKAFNTKVYDTYACNEGFLIAAEMDIKYKYIMTPHVYVEILDDDNNAVLDGEMGNIVVTRLDGYSMPLIRYKIGDLGIKLPREKYPKKRKLNYPLLQQVIGRETDVIFLPDGKKLIVHSFTGIFEYIPEIKQFKVIQEEINSITIQYIKSIKNFNINALDKATKELQKHIKDDNFEIKYVEVDYISPTKSGKPQIIESKIKNN